MKRQLGILTLGALLAGCGTVTLAPEPSGSEFCDPTGGQAVRAANARVGVSAASIAAVSSPRAPNWSAPRAMGQVLVVRQAGTLSAQAITALSSARTQSVGENLTRAFTPPGESDEAFAARLAASGLRTQPDYIYRALAAPTPNDPGYPANGGITASGVNKAKQNYLTTINAKGGWGAATAAGNTGLRGVKVAVLDTGVTKAHQDLQGRLLAGRDFCAGVGTAQNGDTYCQGQDSDTSETSGAEAGHGTNSIGIIGAATRNGKGIAGLTWSGQNMLPVKVFGTDANGDDFADTVSLTGGVNYAVAQHARVINLSLGFPKGGPETDPALSDAIGNAYANNVVMVAAAGNTPNQGLYYPASDPRVISVGAVGSGGTLASYSARPQGDQNLDLVAPGGSGASSPDRILSLSKSASGYQLWAGTSEAAPQVAGAAALLLFSRPNLTVEQVRAALVGGAQTTPDGYSLLDVGCTFAAAGVNP